MTTPVVFRVTARNTARASANKMHDDDVARSYGFSGGLVPGVTVFAWMCRAPMDAYGEAWLDRGAIAARFLRPVYEADDVAVECLRGSDGLDVAVRAREEVCAEGAASSVAHGDPIDPRSFRRPPLPDQPPVASRDTLVPGTALGAIDVVFVREQANDYLRSIGAHHIIPDAAECAHPGWLILLANLALMRNVALGPWIHVSSEMRLHGRLRDGELVSALSRVATEFEKKGHRFVELDVLMLSGDERPIASVRHVAIYEPRRT